MSNNGNNGGGGGNNTMLIVVVVCCCSSLAIAGFLWYASKNRDKFTWLDWLWDLFEDEEDPVAPSPYVEPAPLEGTEFTPSPSESPSSETGETGEPSPSGKPTGGRPRPRPGGRPRPRPGGGPRPLPQQPPAPGGRPPGGRPRPPSGARPPRPPGGKPARDACSPANMCVPGQLNMLQLASGANNTPVCKQCVKKPDCYAWSGVQQRVCTDNGLTQVGSQGVPIQRGTLPRAPGAPIAAASRIAAGGGGGTAQKKSNFAPMECNESGV